MNTNDLPQLPSLARKRIVLGVTGGIAAYKSLELLRLLGKQGALVQVVMTPSACQFVTPLSFQALSGQAVQLSQWVQGENAQTMPHIQMSRNADCLLIAPCTAHAMAKYAQGLAENLLDNLVLARNCPIAVAPAMNVEMWRNPATQRNLHQLQADGVHVFGPSSGLQACGETGEGRMSEPQEIVFALARLLSPKPLLGKKCLITAGPTYEAIDPVRGITNRSSGKMGYAMAQAAHLLGAQVTLISGPTPLSVPVGVQSVQVESAQQMHEAVMQHIVDNEVFIGVAAVADYGVKNASAHKQKKSDAGPSTGLQIEFVQNPDILAEVGLHARQDRDQPLTVIGFAAETENLDASAQTKLAKKNADYIVGNLAQHSLGCDQAELTVYSQNLAPLRLGKQTKLNAAFEILEHIFSHQTP